MADLIEKGDIVTIYYNDGERCDDCKVLHAPCDVGDMWYFEDKFGNVIAQNPTSYNLDSIIRLTKQTCPHNVKEEDAHINNPICRKCGVQGLYCDFIPF